MTPVNAGAQRRGVLALIVAAGLILTTNGLATAQTAETEAAYRMWVETYGDWTKADAEAAGYVVQPVCVTAEAEGLDPALGAMGFHAVNESYYSSGELKTEEPHVVLVDGNDKVVGVEWEWPEVEDPAPTVAGLPLEFTPPHPGVEHAHMSRHVYFVGDEGNRYTTFNPAVECPPEATGERAETHAMEMAGSSSPTTPALAELPQTGAGPSTGHASLVAVILLALGVTGRRIATRLPEGLER